MAVSNSLKCVLKSSFDVPLMKEFLRDGKGFVTEDFYCCDAMHNVCAEPNVT